MCVGAFILVFVDIKLQLVMFECIQNVLHPRLQAGDQ